MYKLSPSTLNLFVDCPRCFWLQFNKGIKRPEGIFPSLPSGMDRILKNHFDSFMQKGLMPPELKDVKGKLFDDVDLLNKWRNNLKGIEYKDKKGNMLHGAIDNLLVHNGKFIVLDFKTRGFPLKEDTHEHYIDQLNIYNYLFRKNKYETEDFAYLLFYHPNKVQENGDVDFNKDLVKITINVQKAEKLFKDAIDCLEGKMPDSSEECKYCSYVENFK